MAQAPSPQPRTEANTVIVIDDDEAVRDSVSVLLEAHGFDVTSFDSALAFLDNDPLPSPGCCLLLDYHMPGMTGVELLIELRRRGVGYRPVLITGLSDGTIEKRALAAGALEVLRKGAPEDAVIDAVRRALVGKGTSARA